jgi:hypothetical protein
MANNNFVVKNGLTVNGSFTANSTAVNASVITATSLNAISVNTATANATTSIVVGANVTISTSSYFVGNATVNTSITGGQLSLSGVTVNSTIYQGTANNSNNFSGLTLTTVQSQITGNAASAYSNAVANSAALYQTTAGLSANVAALTSNNSTYHGGVTLATIQSQITGNSATAYSNAINGTVNNATYFSGQLSSYYTNIPARLGYTPANLAGASFTGSISATQVVLNTGQAYYMRNDGGVYMVWDGSSIVFNQRTYTSGSISSSGDIITNSSFRTQIGGGGDGQVLFGNGARRLYFNGGDRFDFNGYVQSSGVVGPVYYEGSLAVASYWDGGSIVSTRSHYISGNMRASSEVSAGGNIIAYYSDVRLKTNITLIPDALNKVKAIRGVTFNSNDIAAGFGYKDQSKQVGVIAHEIEAVLPEAVQMAPFDREYIDEDTYVSKSGENYKTVQYEKIVPLLIEAIKELSAKVEELEKRI